jgi:transcriptional regulator with XRE-family HTH domain
MELKILRRVARLTQRQLAKKAGVDESTISLIESGKRQNMSHDTAVRIARALNLTAEELFPVDDIAEQPKAVNS